MKPPARIGFGTANVLVACLVASCVGYGLPTRWWVVDAGAAVVVASMSSSGFALLVNHRYARPVTRIAAALVLTFGLASFTTLALTASWLTGIYGPIGKGGAAILALVALLVLPYLVVLPAVLLAWAHPHARQPMPCAPMP